MKLRNRGLSTLFMSHFDFGSQIAVRFSCENGYNSQEVPCDNVAIQSDMNFRQIARSEIRITGRRPL
jgi:hypothetical protein